MRQLAWFCLLLMTLSCRSTPDKAETVPEAPPDVPPKTHAVVLIIDTLRADAVNRAHTPTLDRVGTEGQRIAHAWSGGTWTVPSVISIFTGMPVRQHGWDLGSGRIGRYPSFPSVPTMAEVFQEKGFKTTGLYANTYLSEELGFERGFDTWRKTHDKSIVKDLTKEVSKWKEGQRHFLYLHIMGPHTPLAPSPESLKKYGVDPELLRKGRMEIGRAKRGQEPGIETAYREAYHAVVEDTDQLVQQLLDAMGPHLDDTALVITSDHGELLGDHDRFGHGTALWQSLTHVPFVTRGVHTLPDPINNAAIPDILTHATGLEHNWPVKWSDNLPLVAQREGRVALSPDGRWKGIWTDSLKVYDLQREPNEKTTSAKQHDWLEKERKAWETSVPAGQTSMEQIQLHPETVEGLRQLGYLTEDTPPQP